MLKPSPKSAANKILIVDDDCVTGQLHAALLSRAGYEVEFVSTHRDAIKTLETTPYDLLLLDLYMPDNAGWEFLPKLRKRWTREALPILMLSAEDSEGLHANLSILGADDYLTKPVNVKDLINKAEQWIGRSAVAHAS